MSLQEQLVKSKKILKPTVTIVTRADGFKYEEHAEVIKPIVSDSLGFVVDTKPDDVPALIIPHLYLGAQDCTSATILESYNIRHVISLGVRPFQQVSVVNYTFREFLDLPESDVWQLLQETQQVFDEALEKGDNLLVHCNAGVSRSAALIVAFLMQKRNLEFEEALQIVRCGRSCARPNDGFVKQLKSFKR